MPDILHRVGIKSSPSAVYGALSTIEGLAGWWTRTTRGDGSVGGVFDMKVLELDPPGHVLWEVVDGPAEWIGTRVGFDLKQEDDHTIVLFRHRGWKEPVEFMHHCSTKWAVFLMSLKAYAETGTGTPYPDDVKIDNWN